MNRLPWIQGGVLLLVFVTLTAGLFYLNLTTFEEFNLPFGMSDQQTYYELSYTQFSPNAPLPYYVTVQAVFNFLTITNNVPEGGIFLYQVISFYSAFIVFILPAYGVLLLSNALYPDKPPSFHFFAPILLLVGSVFFQQNAVVGFWAQSVHIFLLCYALAYIIRPWKGLRTIVPLFLITYVSAYTHLTGTLLLGGVYFLSAWLHTSDRRIFLTFIVLALLCLSSTMMYRGAGDYVRNAVSVDRAGGNEYAVMDYVSPLTVLSLWLYLPVTVLSAYGIKRSVGSPGALLVGIVAVTLLVGLFTVHEGRTAITSLPLLIVFANAEYDRHKHSTPLKLLLFAVCLLFTVASLINLDAHIVNVMYEVGYPITVAW